MELAYSVEPEDLIAFARHQRQFLKRSAASRALAIVFAIGLVCALALATGGHWLEVSLVCVVLLLPIIVAL